uniref:p450 monooxygenase n=1 Tax=Sphaceloma manihoticola TaxID=49223 RepID=B5DBY3_9PEZI|nr:P450 monooxygenase [Sphaceloma manihoticola]
MAFTAQSYFDIGEHLRVSVILLLTTVVLLLVFSLKARKKSLLPLVNGNRWTDPLGIEAKKKFMTSARSIIAEQLEKAPGKPFRVVSDVGELVVLPPEFAPEIRNHKDFSFTMAAYKWFYAHLPGMEGFREGTTESQIMKLVARHQLTHQLTVVTAPVAEESARALRDVFGCDEGWRELGTRQACLQVIARVSSRIFLGQELCRNPDWLRVTSTYSVLAFRAVVVLRFWPAPLRNLVHWFLPACKAARDLVQEARDLVNPLLQERNEERRAQAKGESVLYRNDAIDWLEELATDKNLNYDPAASQLSLSTAALHSSTDFFAQLLLDLAERPGLAEELRQEAAKVVNTEGWSKGSLFDLKLMDSVMKESQRLKPISLASMRRYTTADVKMSSGDVIPKGSLTVVSAYRHWDEKTYERPDEFDGHRFLRMRSQEGKEHQAHLVSATQDHFGFGYGLHACPGRFFAAEEVKIVLAQMLLQYEIRLVAGSDSRPVHAGLNMYANPASKISVRYRGSSF